MSIGKPRLFSGMQPTGALHLGNYVGALKNWGRLLDDYDGIFAIVDLHALTVPYDVAQLPARVLDAATDYIAGGLDPKRCTLVVQSQVPQHTELSWVLASVTPLGQLMRMTQFKAKTQQFANEANEIETGDPDIDRSAFLQKAGSVNAGLFTYPILMAADILIYKALTVPVGEDQVQHVELTNDIARRFNHRYKGREGNEILRECKALLSQAPRLMGLDGTNKMSKSVGNHLPMNLSPEELVKRVTKEAASDPARVRKTDPGTPETCNVYSWHKIFSPADEQALVCEGCRAASIGCFDCKKRVALHMANELAPYREKRQELLARPDEVRDILNEGAKRCREIAADTMHEVYDALGLGK